MVNQDSFWLRIIYIFSLIISATVAFLILGPRPAGIEGALDVSKLPLLNASLNGMTTILLVIGYILIRNKKRQQHKNVMLTAFGTSAAFLVSYVIYHWFKSGPKQYSGNHYSISFNYTLSWLDGSIKKTSKNRKDYTSDLVICISYWGCDLLDAVLKNKR
jgi:uncharacterized membrane protein YozB (DUF420 family)